MDKANNEFAKAVREADHMRDVITHFDEYLMHKSKTQEIKGPPSWSPWFEDTGETVVLNLGDYKLDVTAARQAADTMAGDRHPRFHADAGVARRSRPADDEGGPYVSPLPSPSASKWWGSGGSTVRFLCGATSLRSKVRAFRGSIPPARGATTCEGLVASPVEPYRRKYGWGCACG